MGSRVLLALLATLLAGNGLHMLVTPEHWYHSIESVAHTGAFNAHFVRDIGCAYLAAGVGLALGAWRSSWLIPGSITALVFLGTHAALHVWESLISQTAAAAHAGIIDAAGVYGPVVLTLFIVIVACRATPATRSGNELRGGSQ